MNKRQLIAYETKIKKLFLAGKINAPVHLSGGNEDELIEIFKDIRRTDYVFSTWRNHYHYLLHTSNERGLTAEILGDEQAGICKGQSRSMHTIDRQKNFFSSAIVCGTPSIAVGVALALKMKGSKQKVYCFLGDGCTDSGWFFEALRYARNNDLPIHFVVEDNNRSVEATKEQRWGYGRLFYHGAPLKVVYYTYKPTYPHVGSGEWVSF